ERAVVEGELGVEGQQPAVGGRDQRVDLGQRAVAGDEGHVEAADGGGGRLAEVTVEAQPEGEPPDLERQGAEGRGGRGPGGARRGPGGSSGASAPPLPRSPSRRPRRP